MPFNGSGTFNVFTPGNPISNGQTSDAVLFNNTISDLASGLSNTLTKDGQNPATADISLGNHKATNVSNATLRTDAVNAGQVQDGSPTFLTSVSGTNTITASLINPSLVTYATGMMVKFIASGSNSGAVTININGIGAVALTKTGSTALVTGDIIAGSTIIAMYDGTRFQLSSGAGGGGAKAGGVIYENTTALTSNYTLTTGSNGLTVGPLTISSGVSLTVPTGQRMVIL